MLSAEKSVAGPQPEPGEPAPARKRGAGARFVYYIPRPGGGASGSWLALHFDIAPACQAGAAGVRMANLHRYGNSQFIEANPGFATWAARQGTSFQDSADSLALNRVVSFPESLGAFR